MMLSVMRTTISLDDDLLHAAKLTAANQGRSISEVINRALRRVFADEGAPRVAEATVMYDGTSVLSGDDLRRVRDRLDDEETLRKARPARATSRRRTP